MGVEKGLNDARLTKTNSVDLYRPPALRNHKSEIVVGFSGGVACSNATASVAVVSSSTALSSSNTSSSSSSFSSSTATTTNTSISCNNSPTRASENDNDNPVIAVARHHHSNFDNSVTSTNNVAAAAIIPTTATSAAKSSDDAAATALTNGQHRTESRQQQQRRERRPDRAVYIPRARRSQTTPPTTQQQLQQQQQAATSTTPTTTTTTTAAATTITTTSNTASNSNQQQQQQQLPITSDTNALVSVAQVTSTKTDEHCKNTSASSRKLKTSASSSSVTNNNNNNNNNYINNSSNNKERRERVKKSTIITTTTKSNKFLESEPVTATATEPPQEQSEATLIATPPNEKNKVENSKVSILSTNCDNNDQQTLDVRAQTKLTFATPTEKEHTHPIADHIVATNAMNSAKGVVRSSNGGGVEKTSRPSSVVVLDVASAPNLLIEDIVASRDKARRSSKRVPKCDIDAQELQRASKEINRSNRRIIKQTFVSDVLEIPEKIDTRVNSSRSPPSTPTRSKFIDSATEEDEDEEDDWETMFDESGECLDPKIIQELTASVGKVKIELPKMDYSAYLTKQSILNEEEFPHVLEVSNFPVEFKNQDLLMVFSQYKESGFDIKWVDDTHALAVFSSSQIAAEVLAMGHPFVQLKPLAEATVESRLKAKKCSTSLQPYRPRPATCAALARRLVTGALGVRLKTAAAERENEKRVLREAKERKLLAAKQRDEVWES